MKLPNTRHGLFVRLFMIFMGLTIGLGLSIAACFHFLGSKPYKRIIQKNMAQYALYLKNDIGYPPNFGRAQMLADTMELSIMISVDDFIYRSSPGAPGIRDLVTWVKGPSLNGVRIVRDGEQKYMLVEDYGATYVFGVDHTFGENTFPIIPLGAAGLISLFLLLWAYHAVRKMFRPLEDIKEAAGHYANGDFQYDLQVKGHGQLLELTASVKEMAKKIQTMLDSKRELLLAIAHELRTPLTRAKLHLEMLNECNERKELIQDVDEMGALVNDILESERLKDGHSILNLEEVNLEELFRSVIEKFYPEEQINLTIASSPTLTIDRMRYTLVLKNLISNGIRHGEKKPIDVILNKNSWSVIDHGEGVPENELSKLTDAFYRVDKSRVRKTGGLGLGLYLVAQILKAHGQKLEFESVDGLTVSIFFS